MNLPASYCGLVLTDDSRSRLLQKYAGLIDPLLAKGYQMVNARGEPLLHHVTLNMGKCDEALNPNMLGVRVSFYLIEFGVSEKAVAFGVQFVESEHDGERVALFGEPAVRSKNKRPHITVAINTYNGGRPASSNDIEHWEKLENPTQVMGVFTG